MAKVRHWQYSSRFWAVCLPLTGWVNCATLSTLQPALKGANKCTHQAAHLSKRRGRFSHSGALPMRNPISVTVHSGDSASSPERCAPTTRSATPPSPGPKMAGTSRAEVRAPRPAASPRLHDLPDPDTTRSKLRRAPQKVNSTDWFSGVFLFIILFFMIRLLLA